MSLRSYIEDTNAYITSYIKLADAKAGSIVGFNSIITGALGSHTLSIVPTIFAKSTCYGFLFLLALFITSIFLIRTFMCCFKALQPRTPPVEGKDGTIRKNLNSFPDISSFSSHNDYHSAINAINDPDLEDHIIQNISSHNFILSKIAMQKFKHIDSALSALKLTLGMIASLFILTLFSKITFNF